MKLYEKSRAAEFGFTLAEFCELVTDVANRSVGESVSELSRVSALAVCQSAAEEVLETDVRDLGVDLRNRLAQERQA